MTEWEEACRNAARTIYTSADRSASLPPRQVAEEAHYAGGPSVDELERQIIADREAARRVAECAA